jgi:2-dehydro-3-deoxyphosphogluconate aldolase/(4S)-4-hydroxy-2-oxoglutarate aldolase
VTILDVVRRAPVIPVLTIAKAADAVPLCRALVAGGLPVLEITLRTSTALDAIEAVRAALPDAVVGVGTVTRPDELARAARAGARFAVSPGFATELAAAATAARCPLLPGVMTPSEVMAAGDAGFTALKLFPAQPAGGVALLKALAGPFPDVAFCPTGGVTAANAAEYLAQPNVACVGGSWVAPAALVDAGDWAGIERLAREAAALRRR